MYSDRVHYTIRYHRGTLHLRRSKVALNVSAPPKILKDCAFTDSAIGLRASPIVSRHIRLNLTNTMHLHYTCMSDIICVMASRPDSKKDLLLQNSIKLLKTCRNILFSQTLQLYVDKATPSPQNSPLIYIFEFFCQNANPNTAEPHPQVQAECCLKRSAYDAIQVNTPSLLLKHRNINYDHHQASCLRCETQTLK